MLDGISLDQLRAFIAAVDEGSFSAAARKLGRAQSAVSELVANLEGQIGVRLFDRSSRYPQLTEAGRILLADARSIVGSLDFMKSRARGMATGLEPELAVVVDVFVPITAVAATAGRFRTTFPGMPIRLYVEALGAVVRKVQDGEVGLGIVGPQPFLPRSMTAERVGQIEYVMVAAADHPLSEIKSPIPRSVLADHVQLVLTDSGARDTGRQIGVISPQIWRLGDLFAKHAFLLSGLGWGGMPAHTVADDLASGRLAILHVEDMPRRGHLLPLFAIYETANPPGPAGRWLIDQLKDCP